jgi:glycosyltransferase involved in cell wall biosynthesis
MERVPPALYGGTERVVSYLTEELVALGHDVTLFASGDSITDAELVAPCPEALRLSSPKIDPVAAHAYQLEMVASRARQFDVIHFHTDWGHMPVFSRLGVPFMTTLHGRLDVPCVAHLLKAAKSAPVVSISNFQRRPVPQAQWLGTVYHGLPPDLLRPDLHPGKYLAFLGRMCADKGPDIAIRCACTAGVPIRLAAKIDKADQDYFDTVIRPLLREPGVEFVGEIGEKEKGAFLGEAIALLFPIDWPEPFGMVMIEAMSCATPTIAMRRGSVPEIIRDGISGYVVDSELEFLAAIGVIEQCSRAGVRQAFMGPFRSDQMARNYLRLYERLIGRPRDMVDTFPLSADEGATVRAGLPLRDLSRRRLGRMADRSPDATPPASIHLPSQVRVHDDTMPQ